MSARVRKGPRRWRRRLLQVVGGLVVLVALAVFGVVWRLHQGPIRIDFLQHRIEQALNELIAPILVELGGTTLNWAGGGRPVQIRVADVRVLNPGGDRLASFDEIGVGLYRPALLRGKVIPTGLEVRRTSIVLKRNEDGSFELGLEDASPTSGAEASPRLSELLDQWVAPKDPDSPLGRLTEISVVESRVAVHDRMMGVDWGAEKVDVSVKRQTTSLKAHVSLSLEVGDRKSQVTADATYETTDSGLIANVRFEDLVPSAFAKSYPGLEPLGGFDTAVSGSIDMRFSEATELDRVKATLGCDRGAISCTVEVSDLYSTFSGTLDIEKLEPWKFANALPELEQLARVRFPVQGHVEFAIADKAVQSLSFDVKGGKGELSIPEAYPDALLLDGLEIKGSAKHDLGEIELERVKVNLPDLMVDAHLSVNRQGEGYHGELSAGLDAASVKQVGKYWPAAAGANARTWVVKHITEGAVSAVEFDMAAYVTLGESTSFDLGSLTTQFRFAGLRVDPLSPQAAIIGVDGSSTLTADRMDFVIQRARMRELEVGSGKVAITNLSGAGPADLSLDLDWNGPLETVTTILSEPPLELVARDLVRGLQGKATSTLVLGFPLVDEIKRESVRTSVTGQFQDIVWEHGPLPLDLELTGGTLDLSLTGDAMDVQGQVELNGVPVTVEFWQNFTDGDPQQRIVAHADTDDNSRKDLGLPDQPYVSGSATVDLIYLEHPDGSSSITADAGLENSVVRIPEMAWTKPAGEAGHAHVAVELTEQGAWNVEPFDITAGELKASGSLELTSDPFALRQLVVDQLEFAGNDIRGSVSLDPHAGYRIRVTGDQFDAGPLIDYLKARGAPPAGQSPDVEPAAPKQRPGFDFDIRLDTLKLAKASDLNKMSARALIDEKGLKKLDVEAEMKPAVAGHLEADQQAKASADVATVQLTYTPQGAGHRLHFETDNLGGLAAGLHVSTSLAGGAATLDATRASAEAPFTGQFEASGFTLLESPDLAKILELGSFRGMADAFTKEGLWFKKLSADLTFQELRLDIRHGKALGRGFGITAEGSADFKRRDYDLAGAVTPMETLQRLIGHIPLFGRLLAGWHREGIVAVLYSIKGPMKEPQINVKGYSALTPGITREIFKLAPDGYDADDSLKEKKKYKP